MQDCSNASALALELLQACAKPSICYIQLRVFPVPIYILIIFQNNDINVVFFVLLNVLLRWY